MADIKAGVVVVNRFCGATDKEFAEYINYIEGSQEIRQEYLSEYSLFNDYMDDTEKSTGLFTSGNTNLTVREKKRLKEVFQIAQDNNSLMWQTVISFDNRWLEMNGLYDCKTGILDERRLKVYATDSINEMLENEGLENAVWSASIHYNTDNVHIHIATVEIEPHRKTKMVKQYIYKLDSAGDYVKATNGEYVKANGRNEVNKWGVPLPRYKRDPLLDRVGVQIEKREYVGKFKMKSIESCKSRMVNSIIEQKDNNILLNNIIRERIVKTKKENPLIQDAELKEKFLQLHQKMPDVNRNLWNYNNNVMVSVRKDIDELATFYMEKYNPEDFKYLREILGVQTEAYKMAYGNTKRDFAENKMRDLYTRMGNAILKEIKEFDKNAVVSNEEYYGCTDEDIYEKVLKQDEFPVQMQQDESGMIEENKENIITKPVYMEWSDKYKKAKKIILFRNPDYESAITLLEEEYQSGNILAAYELGEIYRYGKGVEIDLKEAEKYYSFAYNNFVNMEKNQGNDMLEYRIGIMMLHGKGVDQDEKGAKEYLKMSALSGNPYAQYQLAKLYLKADDIGQIKEALVLLEKSAGKGKNVMAQYALGKILMTGAEEVRNIEKAKFWLEKAAHNNSYAQYTLGKLYDQDEYGICNYEKAAYYYEQSGNAGNEYACLALGKLFLRENNQEKQKQGVTWLQRACEFKNPYALYALGKIYIERNSFLYNPEEGIELLKQSADQNNEYAKLTLGIAYLKGEVVKKDVTIARDYLKQSADQGNEYAKNILNNMDKHNIVDGVLRGFRLRRGKKTGYETERALRALKKSLDDVRQKYLNELEYKKLQKKMETDM